MTPPRVSVVMPSYNQGRFIREAIESVVSQDYPSLELVVMDGGSTDETVGILESFGDRLVFVSEKDRGQADAINRGLGKTTGEILCWLNSDDLLAHRAISEVVWAFESHPDADFVYGRGWNIDFAGRNPEDSGVLPFDLWRLIHQRNFFHQPSCFFKRSLFEKAGPLDEGLHFVMDWDLWIRFSAYRPLYVDAYFSSNRTYPENKTQRGQLRRWREIRRMVGRYTDQRWPPVVTLYLLEALLQTMRAYRFPKWLESPLSAAFARGIGREMSGHHPDRGVERHFCFSVGNPTGRPWARVSMSPLSCREPARRGGAPVRVVWKSSSGHQGTFMLNENEKRQTFRLPLGGAAFVHFRCKADGLPQDPGCPVVAFLDEVVPEA